MSVNTSNLNLSPEIIPEIELWQGYLSANDTRVSASAAPESLPCGQAESSDRTGSRLIAGSDPHADAAPASEGESGCSAEMDGIPWRHLLGHTDSAALKRAAFPA